jgi:hypothetical protein
MPGHVMLNEVKHLYDSQRSAYVYSRLSASINCIIKRKLWIVASR